MNRKRFILFAALLLAVGLATVAGVWWYSASQPMGRELGDHEVLDYALQHKPKSVVEYRSPAVESIPPSRRIRLAVGWLGLPDETQNRQIADLIVAQLSSEKNLELVDRQSLNAVLRESELSLAGLVRADSAVRVGKLLRADWFLMGSTAVVNGTNSVVARIVDSRTGAMRDIVLLPLKKEPLGLAEDLAQFARQCRGSASSARPRTYLAVGDFDDMSLNTHQAAFGEQLRAHLTAALRANTNLTVLERDGVETLLQEMRLDLAGLTEEQTANPAAQIQSAIWTVDGYYQSYENQGQDVELVLQIHPAFGLSLSKTLRGAPGEVLFHIAQQTVEKVVADAPKAMFPPSRKWEIREATQTMESHCPIPDWFVGTSLVGPFGYYQYAWNEKGTELQIRHRREEGLRAGQRVLLLDPTNRLAMFYMGIYLQDPLFHRDEEARNYFKEAAAIPVDDRLRAVVMGDLAVSYARTDVNEAIRYLKTAREQFKSNETLQRLLTDESTLELAGVRTVADNINPNPVQEDARQQLFITLQKDQGVWIKQRLWWDPNVRIDNFIKSFGPREEAGLEAYQALLPSLKEKFPGMAPYFVESAFFRQINSDNPFAVELEQTLAFCAEHPDKVIEPDELFHHVSDACYDWCLNHQQYALAVRLLQTKGREWAVATQMGTALNARSDSATARSNMVATLSATPVVLTNAAPPPASSGATNADIMMLPAHDKISLARCYARMERWQDALDIVDSIANRPAIADAYNIWDHPWESLTIPGFTNDADAFYRKKLGLPLPADDKLMSLGDPCLRLQSPFAFSTDSQGIWVAQGPTLLRLDFNVVTNEIIPIPNRNGSDDTVICQGPAQFWVGTDGSGLIEYDQATHKRLRQWTERDGLYSDHVSRLCLDNDTLWIGFSYQGRGAVGRIDLPTGRVSALTPRLSAEPRNPWVPRPGSYSAEAPREAVTGLTMGSSRELYVSTTGQVLRYRIQEDKWDDLQHIVTISNAGLAFDGLHLFVNQTHFAYRRVTFDGGGHAVADPDPLSGLAVETVADSRWEYFGESNGLPLPFSTATALHGKDIWMGGTGYIGVFDLEKKTMRKRGYMQAKTVDHLEVANGFLWAQFGGDLYRIPLSAAE